MKCKDRIHYVYEHISPSGKIYVGQTNNINKRWFPSSYKGCLLFYNAILKYGWNNFIHNIVARKCTQNEANYLEKRLISLYKSQNISYNITDGGEGVLGYVPWNKGTKGAMPPVWNKGIPWSENTRLKISKSKLGRKYGKQSESHIRNKAEKRKVAILQFDIDGRYVREWKSAKDVELKKGFNRKAIGQCLTGKANSSYGYIWIYKKEATISQLLDRVAAYEKGTKYFSNSKIPEDININGINSITYWLNKL